MNLAEFQKLHGIKRIDFDKLHRTDIEEQDDTDRLICPYCGEVIEYEAEDIDDILGGTPMQCPECEICKYNLYSYGRCCYKPSKSH